MFKKPFASKPQSHLLKSSDKKKLLSLLHRQFPNASEDDWELLIPKKQDIYLMQAKLKDGDSVVIYSNDQDPLFFGYDDSELFPSLYALWKCPSIVKPIYTPPAVSQFVLNGADLMLPGVLEDPQDAFQKNEKRCVLVRGNTKAICVGKMACSFAEAEKKQWKGKAVIVYHVFNDALFKLGSKTMPEGFSAYVVLQQEAPQNQTETQTTPTETNQEEQEETTTSAPEESSVSVEEMDALCELCFIEAAKNSVKDDELPMDASAIFNRMMDCRPENTFIDMKKSSHKKLSKFIKAMTKKKYIKSKEVQGSLQIVSMNRSHPDFMKHKMEGKQVADSNKQQAQQQQQQQTARKLEIHSLFKPTSAVAVLFPQKDALFSEEDINDALIKYGESQKLFANEQRNHIKLDEFLYKTLFKKNEDASFNQLVSVTQLVKRVEDKMTPHYAIINSLQPEPLIKRGKLEPIQIVAETVRGNKAVTKVLGLDNVGVEFTDEEFLSSLRSKMSASVKIRESDQKPSMDNPDLLVQGHCLTELSQFLQQYWGIPKKYVVTEDKSKKKKK